MVYLRLFGRHPLQKLCKYESSNFCVVSQLFVICLYSKFHKLVATGYCNVWSLNGLRTWRRDGEPLMLVLNLALTEILVGTSDNRFCLS